MERYRSCGNLVTDSSQAAVIYFFPDFIQIATFLASNASARHFESYATDDFITPCLSPCFVEGC